MDLKQEYKNLKLKQGQNGLSRYRDQSERDPDMLGVTGPGLCRSGGGVRWGEGGDCHGSVSGPFFAASSWRGWRGGVRGVATAVW